MSTKWLVGFTLLYILTSHAFAHDTLVVGTVRADAYVSKHYSLIGSTDDEPIYTVPSGKTFVLTDVIAIINGTGIKDLRLSEDTTIKADLRFDDLLTHYKFETGLVFGPSTVVNGRMISGLFLESITLVGYLY